MAVIHHTTLTPGKLELLATWLPAQPWYQQHGGPPDLERAGGFRLDDPDGAVGIEFMVVTDRPTGLAYQVPLTYRGQARPGSADGLVTTAEHGVLGRRWVYDGTRDPVLVGQLIALLQGQTEPQAQRVSDTPDPTVTTGPPITGRVLDIVSAAAVTSTAAQTELQVPVSTGVVTVTVNRVLRAGPGPGDTPGVSATWQQPDGTQARGVFATARYR